MAGLEGECSLVVHAYMGEGKDEAFLSTAEHGQGDDLLHRVERLEGIQAKGGSDLLLGDVSIRPVHSSQELVSLLADAGVVTQDLNGRPL